MAVVNPFLFKPLAQTTITGTWSDTYSGWIGDTDTLTGSIYTYHGPWVGFGSIKTNQSYTFEQSFYCNEVLSDVTVTYWIIQCDTESDDRVEVTISTAGNFQSVTNKLNETKDTMHLCVVLFIAIFGTVKFLKRRSHQSFFT